MKVVIREGAQRPVKSDLLAVFAFKDEPAMLPRGTRLPPRALEGFDGALRAARRCDAESPLGHALLVVGLGPRKELGSEELRRGAAVAVRQAEELKASSLAIHATDALLEAAGGAARAGRALAEGAALGAYRFDQGKSAPKKAKLQTTALHAAGAGFRGGAERGLVLAEACALARDLGNAPANRMRPRDLAARAKALERRSPRIACKLLGAAEMKRERMGALLSVAAGSAEPPYLVHLTYRPPRPKAARGRGRGRSGGAPRKVAVIGKGLTFDSGGISIKPAAKMWEMKYDMCGGAAVLGLFHALAELDLPIEVHGLVPACENMPDAAATKPGDLVTAMNGTTIEVLNTDAEGRLALCDALCYAVRRIEPDTIVDLATLTGAVVMALGHEFSGLFATNPDLERELVAAGLEVGEELWPLPLRPFHKEWLKGEVADLKNIATGEVGAGSTVGAAFLWHFAGKAEWAHIDIAGAAWGGRNRDWVGGPTASGVGPRLLVQWLEGRAR